MPVCFAVCTSCLRQNKLRIPFPHGKPGCGYCHRELHFEDACRCPVCPRVHYQLRKETASYIACRCRAKLDNIPLEPKFVTRSVRKTMIKKLADVLSGRRSEAQRMEEQRRELFHKALGKYNSRHREWENDIKDCFERTEWRELYTRYRLARVKSMKGSEFETFLHFLFIRMGYSVQRTWPLAGC